MSSQFKAWEPVIFYPYPSYVGLKKKTGERVTVLDQSEMPPEKWLGFRIAESTNIYNAVVNTCKNAGMFLIDEEEMVAKKKFNEGKID